MANKRYYVKKRKQTTLWGDKMESHLIFPDLNIKNTAGELVMAIKFKDDYVLFEIFPAAGKEREKIISKLVEINSETGLPAFDINDFARTFSFNDFLDVPCEKDHSVQIYDYVTGKMQEMVFVRHAVEKEDIEEVRRRIK